MDIRQLKYFIAVVENKGFSRAAETLYLSQSTLSKVVKSLEDELDTVLLDRSNKQIELTGSGNIVYQQGIQVLHSLDNITNQLFDIENLKQGHIHIGLPPISGTLYFPEIIKTFTDLYPRIDLQIYEAGAYKVKNALLDGTVDIVVSMELESEANLDVIPLINDPLVVYVNQDHPLARQSSVTLTDLKNESFIALTSDYELRKKLIYEYYKSNFKPSIQLESAQWDFILSMVNEGFGITVMPYSLSSLLNFKKITTIPIENDEMTMDINFVVKSHKPLSTPLKAFIEYTKEHIQTMKFSNT